MKGHTKDAKKAARTRRQRGSGSLLKRSGYWVLRWHEGGRLCQETTPYRIGEKDARANAEARLAECTKLQQLRDRRDKLAVLIAELQDVESRIKELEKRATPRLRLSGLAEAYRKSPRRKDCSAAMLDDYCGKLAQFAEWAGGKRAVADVGDALAEKYAAHLGETVSGNTANKHLNALTACWNALQRAEGLRGNPWQGIPRKRLAGHPRRVLTQEEIGRLLAATSGELRALFLIGARTGLRLGDAVRLHWEDFDAAGVLRVRTSKTGAGVVLPAARLLADLRAILGGAEEGAITPWAAKRHAANLLNKEFIRIFRRAKVTMSTTNERGRKQVETGFHALRHTFITRLIEAGIPPPIVRELVGHASAAMTERYTHISETAILAAFGGGKVEI